jgi:hypothetical protein
MEYPEWAEMMIHEAFTDWLRTQTEPLGPDLYTAYRAGYDQRADEE